MCTLEILGPTISHDQGAETSYVTGWITGVSSAPQEANLFQDGLPGI